jgi:hypothetical protein
MAKHPMEDALANAESYVKRRQHEQRLAAAAPDLLAALKLARFIAAVPRYPRSDEWRAIDAALAKAEPPP